MITIRIYGIPMKHCSVKNVRLVVEKLGQISLANPIPVHIRVSVWERVQDTIIIVTTDNIRLKVYLHYERIGRIYTFCCFGCVM